jgi:hypothetical protein
LEFDEALADIRWGYFMRRANWRTSIGWSAGMNNICMFWPSGFVEVWRPTLADIQSSDWERAT